MQRREPNDESNPAAATDRHDFHQCRSEVCWQIRRQALQQGDDTTVTTERVGEAITFKSKLADESTWMWLTSEQMNFDLRPTGGGEHKERAEDLDSSNRVRDHLVVYHLAPVMTDFILDENWECCSNELEQTRTLLHTACSKEIEPSRQNSTHRPLIVSNPIDEKGPEFMRRNGGERPRCQQLHMALASFMSKKRHW